MQVFVVCLFGERLGLVQRIDLVRQFGNVGGLVPLVDVRMLTGNRKVFLQPLAARIEVRHPCGAHGFKALDRFGYAVALLWRTICRRLHGARCRRRARELLDHRQQLIDRRIEPDRLDRLTGRQLGQPLVMSIHDVAVRRHQN